MIAMVIAQMSLLPDIVPELDLSPVICPRCGGGVVDVGRSAGVCDACLENRRRGILKLWDLKEVYSRIMQNISVTHAGCWEYCGGSLHTQGYGMIDVGGRKMYTHRVLASLAAGRLLRRRDIVRHSCDNPPCCNPDHLAVGTQADNVRDTVSKGRHAKGDKSGARIMKHRLVVQAKRLEKLEARIAELESENSNLRLRLSSMEICDI